MRLALSQAEESQCTFRGGNEQAISHNKKGVLSRT
jgi:hypothetical protein